MAYLHRDQGNSTEEVKANLIRKRSCVGYKPQFNICYEGTIIKIPRYTHEHDRKLTFSWGIKKNVLYV